MADTTSASVGEDTGAKEGGLLKPQPTVDVEMEDLSMPKPELADANAKSSHSQGGEGVSTLVAPSDPPIAESSSSAQPDAPASPEVEELTIDPVDPQASGGAPAVSIMLQLTNGVRHPFRIDEKYLSKRNVTVTGKTEDGSTDPASITVYTLKELILRDWRKEWEEPPREPSSIRLIHFGKLLEDRNQLSHYHFSTTTKNWVHMTIKPQDLLDEEEAAKKVKDSSSHHGRSGCCVIL
ncbi:ubiquitin-related domain-containing protein [Xylaria sp. CBS 124048]|nr:ubiquitin-related domain-containing protein [Xylaria sp. CBS 124048]